MAYSTLDIVLIVGFIVFVCAVIFGLVLWNRRNQTVINITQNPTTSEYLKKYHEVSRNEDDILGTYPASDQQPIGSPSFDRREVDESIGSLSYYRRKEDESIGSPSFDRRPDFSENRFDLQQGDVLLQYIDQEKLASDLMEDMIRSVRWNRWKHIPIEDNIRKLALWYHNHQISFDPRNYPSQQPMREEMIKLYTKYNIPFRADSDLFKDGLTLEKYIDATKEWIEK